MFLHVSYGHKKEFLKDVDLDRKGLFNENNLIYTVKDEHGSPVGFAARDLLYEEKQGKYEKQLLELAKKFCNDEKAAGTNKERIASRWAIMTRFSLFVIFFILSSGIDPGQ